MKNFPQLRTARLLLDQPTIGDLEDLLVEINSTIDIAANTSKIPYPYTEEHAKIWFKLIEVSARKKEAYIFAIRQLEDEHLIGAVGLHLEKSHQKAEVGYWLGKSYWNNGLVSEALKEVIKYGFEKLNLNKIYATHFDFNPASGKVLQKSGMQFEGNLKQEYRKNGKFLDVLRYAVLKEDFS